jgi:hypothetical protein
LAVPIADLALDPRNARAHGEENIAAIAASLKAFGQLKPIVANRRNREIVAGNGTFLAAKRLGWTHLAVVWVEQDPAQQTGFSVADNRSAELADWDDAKLEIVLNELSGAFPDLYDDLLLDQLREPEPPDESDPTEPSAADQPIPESFKIVVTCANGPAQQELFERFQTEGLDCRLLTL